jgi:hypothetical protein
LSEISNGEDDNLKIVGNTIIWTLEVGEYLFSKIPLTLIKVKSTIYQKCVSNGMSKEEAAIVANEAKTEVKDSEKKDH